MGKIFTRDGKYGIDYTDHRGRRIRKVVARDKSVAQTLLAQAIKAVEQMRAGMVSADPRETKKPIKTHVEAYLADMVRRGRDAMYVYIVKKHLKAAIEDRGWKSLAECSARSVSEFLRVLAGRKLSGKSVNDYRGDLSAFFRWCTQQGLMEANPCLQVAKTTVKREKTRRALTVAECQRLLSAAPEHRRVVYLFLIFTGLRRSEAAALRWGHVHIDISNPFVELPASLTKSGKRESIPVVGELATALRRHRADAKDDASVFDAIPTMPEFREDLAAANIEGEDGRGRKVVLHSLRHSLATMLVVSGVPMAFAQRILRHRDIKLTAEVYCDEGLLPLAAAMNSLPTLTIPPTLALPPGPTAATA